MPYPVVIGFAHSGGKFVIFQRTKHVRSAKEALSIPSGLCEVGIPMFKQFSVELKEEFNLTAIPDTFSVIGVYENISHDDQWHWVLILVACEVNRFDELANCEPDKHENPRLVNMAEFTTILADPGSKFAPGLREACQAHLKDISDLVGPAR